MTAPDLVLPLRIKAHEEAFGVVDARGRLACYVYFDAGGDEVRRSVRNRMTRAEAEEVVKVCARALTARLRGEPAPIT